MYEFKDPDTGYKYSGSTMQQLMHRIIAYRVQNKLPLIDELSSVVENYLCQHPLNTGMCQENKILARGFMGYLKGGIALLINMAYNKFASQDEADSRSEICAKCPHNVFPDKGAFIQWADEVAEKSVGKRKSKYHELLGNCEICSCTLRAKVFYAGKIDLPKDQIEKMIKVNCWQPPLIKK